MAPRLRRGQPSAVSFAIAGTSTAAASRKSSTATKANGTHQLVLLPLPGWA